MITCPICKTEFCRNDAPADCGRIIQNTAELLVLLIQAKKVISASVLGNPPDVDAVIDLQTRLTEALTKLKTET